MEPLQSDWLQSAQETRRQGTRGLLADTPRSRRSDPETSHEAAEQVRRSGDLGRQQLAVLEAVKRWPGLTSLELAARLNLDRYQVARRLPEIEAALRVRRGDIKSINGRNHLTWWPL
jgi:hypothetical protein